MLGMPWWKHSWVIASAVVASVMVLVLVLGFTSVRILQQQSTSVWTERFVRVVPLPAAFVDGRAVMYRDLLPRWRAIDTYLEGSPEPTDPNLIPRARQALRQEVYEGLIREKVLAREAARQQFVFAESAVEANMERLLTAPDGTTSTREQVAAAIELQTGWTWEQYRDWLVRPAVFEQGFQQFVMTAASSTQAEWDQRVSAWISAERVRRFLRFSEESG